MAHGFTDLRRVDFFRTDCVLVGVTAAGLVIGKKFRLQSYWEKKRRRIRFRKRVKRNTTIN